MNFPEVQIVKLNTTVDRNIVEITPLQQTIQVEAYKTKFTTTTTTRAKIGG